MCGKILYGGKAPMPPYFDKDSPNVGILFIMYIFVFEAVSNKFWLCIYAFILIDVILFTTKRLEHSSKRSTYPALS